MREEELDRELRAHIALRTDDLVARGMTREDAVRLQRRARSLGLPRDTFVQNYTTYQP